MRIATAYPLKEHDRRRTDGLYHAVTNARDLETFCSRIVVQVLPFIPISEFGRPGEFEWCPRRMKKIKARERSIATNGAAE